MGRGLGAIGGHDDPLASGQGIILHDVGGTEDIEGSLDLFHGGAGKGAGGRHAGVRHDLLREGLGGLQTGRVPRWAKNGDTVVQNRIRDARDERGLGANNHEIDLLRGRATHDVLRVERIHGQ